MLKKNVAHKVIISIHRLYIPKIASILADRLHDSKLMSDKHYEELKAKIGSAENKSIRIDFAELMRRRQNATNNKQ